MGINRIIRRMKPKRKKLYDTLIYIIFTLVFARLIYVIIVDLQLSFISVFTHPVFFESVIVFLMLGICLKILHGGSIKPPDFVQK